MQLPSYDRHHDKPSPDEGLLLQNLESTNPEIPSLNLLSMHSLFVVVNKREALFPVKTRAELPCEREPHELPP